MTVRECDVLVIGGGPAGATAAHLLASWGRSVVVLHRPPAAHLTLAESLPASTRKLLRFLGQLDRVEAAAFYPNTGNIANWAGTSRVTTSPDAGFHVARGPFDDVLRDAARAAGAAIVEGAAQSIGGDDSTRVGVVAADGTAFECRAAYVLDCSGRAGVIARRGLRRATAGYRTLAVVAEWECDTWPADERPYTTIESYTDGWAWSVPLSATRRQCTVMMDPPSLGPRPSFGETGPPGLRPSFGETGALPASPGLPSLYERELEKARGLRTRLADARRVSAPWTCDASLYDCVRAADEGTLLVGDASSFIEPLSSAGVKKALLSAWRAAVVTNTCLAKSGLAGTAVDLYVRRERDVFAECTRRSAAFFAEAAAAHGTPFWAARAESAASIAGAAGDNDDLDDADGETAGRDHAVRTAFEQLRSADRIRLRPATTLRFAALPTIGDREIVMREAILMPGLKAPLQFAAGVDLARLARIAARCDDVPTIIEAYQQHVAPAPMAGVLTGLSLLVARHALVAEEPTS